MIKVAKNLLAKKVDPELITLTLDDNEDFTYNPMEGGFISHDRAVILITDRRPYNGMMLQFSPCDESIIASWVNRMSKMLETEGNKINEQSHQ